MTRSGQPGEQLHPVLQPGRFEQLTHVANLTEARLEEETTEIDERTLRERSASFGVTSSGFVGGQLTDRTRSATD